MKPRRYYPLLDAFRFLAAVGVVWLHVAAAPGWERSRVLGRFAVPFFTCAAVFLAFDALRRRPGTTIGSYLDARVRRVYGLFLAWSVIYWAARAASTRFVEHRGWWRPTPREFLLDGVAIQLWFLPFITVATVTAFAVAKLAREMPATRWPLTVLTVLTGLAAAVLPTPGWVGSLGYGPGLAYGALPSWMWGIALGLSTGGGNVSPASAAAMAGADDSAPPRPLVPAAVAALGAAGFVVWLVAGLLYGHSMFWENVSGLGLVLLAFYRVVSRPVPLLATLGAISFGVYLAHALFVEGSQHLMPRFGVHPGGGRDLLILLLAVAGSSVLILALKRGGRWTAWLAG